MKTIVSPIIVRKIELLFAKILGKSMFSKDDSLSSCTCGHCYTYSEPPMQELSNDVHICHQISKLQKNIFSGEHFENAVETESIENSADILGRS